MTKLQNASIAPHPRQRSTFVANAENANTKLLCRYQFSASLSDHGSNIDIGEI